MALKVNPDSASSEQIEAALCQELAELRLARNITQQQLADLAGVSVRTVKRLEAGEGTSLDTFIRLLKALGIAPNLENLVPDQRIRPLERVQAMGNQRRRARPLAEPGKKQTWSWDD